VHKIAPNAGATWKYESVKSVEDNGDSPLFFFLSKISRRELRKRQRNSRLRIEIWILKIKIQHSQVM
jgi:hypothetical protein